MSDTNTTDKRAIVLGPQRMQLAEQWRQDYVVNAEEGQTIEDIVNPMYWSLTCAKLQQFDRIEVRMETGEWIAELVVKEVGRTFAIVHLLNFYDLTKNAADTPAAPGAAHKVQWGGAHHRFRVIRIADSAVLQSGLQDKSAAEIWLANYERTVATT